MKGRPTITVAGNGNLQVHIPMIIRRMRGRKQVIAPQALDGEIPEAAEPFQAAVIQALARAFLWAQILETGQVKSISELASNLEVDGSYVTRRMKLTTLEPEIVEWRGARGAVLGQIDPVLFSRSGWSRRSCLDLRT